jgi:hypothetical protein
MVSLFYVVPIRFIPSYTKVGGLRICKVRVGRTKWRLYFVLFTDVYSVLQENQRFTYL